MAYEVLARKWRPQQFDDIVGQEHVTGTLKNAITSNRVAHAYLFVGPRGIGKTSVARILAKALNCADGTTVTPCDKCDSCREIMTGSSLDVLEIDGASNNGVDQVRDLRDNVRYAPARGPFKVYIIDEVHMLTTQAFNALLKTLEEPPPHVKFIFATTEPQKILATIVSRCQRFDLRKIPAKLIVERLTNIAESENVKISEDALMAVARGADGGLRDATSALDQLIAFRGKQINEEDVLAVFGLVSRRTLDELAGALLHSDIPRLLRLVAEFDEHGKDMQRVVIELLDHLRNLLVYLHGGDNSGLDLTNTQLNVVKKQASLTDVSRALKIMDLLAEAEEKIRYALSKRILLEMTLIRCARTSSSVSLEQILAQINRLKDALGEAPLTEEAETRGPGTRVKPEAKREQTPQSGQEINLLTQNWHEIIERIGKSAALAKNALIDARPLAVEKDKVVIGLDPEFADQQERLSTARNRTAVQRVLSDVLKREVTAEFKVVTENGSGKTPDGNVSVEPAQPASKKTRQEWLEEPTVQKTLEMFNGSIIDVRE